MASVIPQIVRDMETGKICIQIKIGSEVATQELPDNLATATKDELKSYFDSVVPEMLGGLRDTRRKKAKKLYEKAAHVSKFHREDHGEEPVLNASSTGGGSDD